MISRNRMPGTPNTPVIRRDRSVIFISTPNRCMHISNRNTPNTELYKYCFDRDHIFASTAITTKNIAR